MDAVRDERGKPTGEFTDKMKDLIREHNLNMELPAEAEKFLPVARRHNLTMREICNRYARQNMARASKEDPKRIPGPYAHLRDDDPMFELLEWCLDINPATRATAAKALEHPWFQEEDAVEGGLSSPTTASSAALGQCMHMRKSASEAEALGRLDQHLTKQGSFAENG
eukprot:CAMPEP_0177737312 /NCGR_PEP_ID=MMETSP0484_2-20121128/25818_1 /TAXON_ID=354590 /ORGANISM="Rhodomonas lens, Strain RHODO" /LENGTH=167 /DNA_ID=CAMNT_0019251085 /DNA_START=41 /DNA_END=541 /DNA_ORIENTATION=+